MNYEALEQMQRLIDRLDDPTLPSEDFGVVGGTVVGTTPIVTEQDGEIYAYLAPIYADWCE